MEEELNKESKEDIPKITSFEIIGRLDEMPCSFVVNLVMNDCMQKLFIDKLWPATKKYTKITPIVAFSELIDNEYIWELYQTQDIHTHYFYAFYNHLRINIRFDIRDLVIYSINIYDESFGIGQGRLVVSLFYDYLRQKYIVWNRNH